MDRCDEMIRVEVWQIENFERLGFDRLESIDALSAHIDYHDVEKLIQRGCEKTTALRIATPVAA